MAFNDEGLTFLYGEDLADYRTYQHDHFDAVNAVFSICVGTYIVFVTNNPLYITHYEPLHGLSIIICASSYMIFVTFMFARITEAYISEDKCMLRRVSHLILKSPWLRFAGPDGVAFLAVLGMGIGLYASVLNGQCDKNVNYWDVGRCNYTTSLKAAPTVYVLYMCILPLYLQHLLRGLSFRMAIITWIISASAVAVSIMQASNTMDFAILGCSVRVLLMVYSYEKLSRVLFIKNRTLAAANFANRAHMVFKQESEQQRITEKKKYELEIRAFKAEEDRRLMESERKQMVALLGNVAHDLKTPLQAFLMDLESLKAALEISRKTTWLRDDPNSPQSIVSSLISTCSFMNMAINRSIDFVKAERRINLTPIMETVNIQEVISMTLNFVKHLKSCVSIEVSLLPATLCGDIITDKHWFMENMLCLLSNAVKYSNKGVIRVTLDYINGLPESDPPYCDQRDEEPRQSSEVADTDGDTSSGANPCILISVEDAGIGISEKERMDLFQPFKQVQRLAGGTGLGLYSLSSRIHALQGSRGVSARKDGNQGSTFWFAIPYRPDPNVNGDFTEPPSPQSTTPSTQSSYSDIDTHFEGACTIAAEVETDTEAVTVSNRRFLVVDDSPSILRVVSRVLTNKKYLVETADNGSAGLDLLIDQFESRHFDVVLMDLQMPVMDGIEAVKRYREYESAQNESLSLSLSLSHSQDITLDGLSLLEPGSSPINPSPSPPKGRRLFIIGMSANSDGPTKQCALDAGMDCFLPKPFSVAELQPLIDRLSAA